MHCLAFFRPFLFMNMDYRRWWIRCQRLRTGYIRVRWLNLVRFSFFRIYEKKKVCSKPTSSKPGLCRKHANSYYVIQYINRLQDRAIGAMVQELGNQIAQENLNHPLTYE